MILVTGATGFIGQAFIRHLISRRRQVRLLLRPGKQSPRLPKGVAVDAVVCSLWDERALAAAMKDVTHVVHLAGSERLGSRAPLEAVEVRGTRVLAEVASKAGIKRFVYLSHLGADRASAFPLLKAKGIAENLIIASGVPYTILRSAVVYGPGDQFVSGLAMLLKKIPGVFLMPGEGNVYLQPLWIEDLVSALEIALDHPQLENQSLAIGGPEYLTLNQMVNLIMEALGLKRWVVSIPLGSLKILALLLEQVQEPPLSIYWLDYLSADRTTALDTLPRVFGIIPARFHQQRGFLKSARYHQRILPGEGVLG